MYGTMNMKEYGPQGRTNCKNQNNPCKTLDRPLGLQEIEALSISSQSANESVKVVSSTHRPTLAPGNIHGTHAEPTTGPKCGRKD